MTESENEKSDSRLNAAIRFCGLYEAELLVELMLRFWNHPNSADRDFRNYLVEAAAEVLERSRQGEQFIDNIKPMDMNFVAAVWYVESCQVTDLRDANATNRSEWLEKVRRSIPACFCDPRDLTES